MEVDVVRDRSTGVTVQAAMAMALEAPVSLRTERAPLGEALGRVLAQDLVAPVDVPGFDRSAMDGFAVRRRDIEGASAVRPARLRVLGAIYAGPKMSGDAVTPGTAVRIATGAAMPPGADAVVPIESTRPDGEGGVLVMTPLTRKSNVSPQGEEIARGQTIVRAGERLGPEAIALVAAVGRDWVEVFHRPRVGLLATGDEVREVGRPLGPGEVYNSGRYALAACVERDGGLVVGPVEPVPDDAGRIASALSTLLDQGADLIVTTGGVSVGERDLVPAALEAIGAEILFRRVRMRPGKACALAACRSHRYVFALSGNPAAALTSYALIARLLLLRMGGQRVAPPRPVKARLLDGYSKASPQERYLRAALDVQDGVLVARPWDGQGASAFRTWLGTDALVVVPAGSGPLREGAWVDVLPVR